jgi:hypothetical protein
LAEAAFRLKLDGLGNKVTQLCQELILLLKKKINYIRCGNDSKFPGVKLAMLAHNLAQNLIANRLRSFDFAFTLARGTWLTGDMG